MYVHLTRKVGPKGQVVIPGEIREELGIGPGTELEFGLRNREIVVKPSKSAKQFMEEWRSIIPKHKKLKTPFDVDAVIEEEIDSEIEEELRELSRHKRVRSGSRVVGKQ